LTGDGGEAFGWGAAGLVALLVAWELGARTGVVPVQYSSQPTIVLATAARMIGNGQLLQATSVSATELAIGLGLAIVTGIPLGLASGWYRRLNYAVDPYLAALYATPSLTLVPLLVLWFGLGSPSTVALVFVSAFFPLTINLMYGVRTIDPILLKMARSFRASQRRVFSSVVLPGAVPYLVTGLRLALVRGLIAVVVGEIYSSRQGGLGYIIAVAGSSMNVDRMFVAVGVIAAVGVLSMAAIGHLERSLQHWKPALRT
jgi:NitT/TauT family transport system permease protein